MSKTLNNDKLFIEESKKKINLIFLNTQKRLEELHQKKIKLISKYEKIKRNNEIKKIRQDLKQLSSK